MHKYTAKLSLLLLIILEASVYDEGVLSEGVLSRRSLCLDGVMYGGGFVRGGFVLPSSITLNVNLSVQFNFGHRALVKLEQ